jgi:hypothetical protein
LREVDAVFLLDDPSHEGLHATGAAGTEKGEKDECPRTA